MSVCSFHPHECAHFTLFSLFLRTAGAMSWVGNHTGAAVSVWLMDVDGRAPSSAWCTYGTDSCHTG